MPVITSVEGYPFELSKLLGSGALTEIVRTTPTEMCCNLLKLLMPALPTKQPLKGLKLERAHSRCFN